MNKYMYHFWKWGFLVLLSIFLAGGIFVIFKSSQPVQQMDAPVTTNEKAYDNIPIELNRSQMNDLSVAYLSQFQDNNDFNYHFSIGKKYAILGGQIEVLGKKVQFALTMDPQVTKNGNVKLKAHGLTVGSLKLPAKVVLKYISRNYELPKWVMIDGDEALLRLDQIKTNNKVRFQVQKIDVPNDQFKFIIKVPKSTSKGDLS